jgi:ElaB/YqjD/DUF883 family membrane-anchored ribosome-binding protein
MSNMERTARETGKDAREAVKDANKAATAGARDIQQDLEALRDDVARLTQQLAGIVGTGGNKTWNRARSTAEGYVSDVQGLGMEAVGAVREVGDNVVEAIDESLRKRPYTTLAIAAAIGFLFGATWRR